MKTLKIGILAIFLILFYCDFQFSEWRIKNAILENSYYTFYFALGLISIAIICNYLISKIKLSPILISGIFTAIFTLISIISIGSMPEIKQMIFPITFMSLFFFAIFLVYIFVLKSNKIISIILKVVVLSILGYFQFNQLDLANKYLSDKKVLSEKNGEKIVVRNVKNMKSNKVYQDTVKVKDVGIFRKRLK